MRGFIPVCTNTALVVTIVIVGIVLYEMGLRLISVEHPGAFQIPGKLWRHSSTMRLIRSIAMMSPKTSRGRLFDAGVHSYLQGSIYSLVKQRWLS
jgi:hypothetical protein